MKRILFAVLMVLVMVSASFAADEPAPKSAKAKALYEKAVTAGNHGNFKDALNDFKSVTEMEPSYAPAYNGWGICLTKLSRFKEATEKFQKATRLSPRMGKAYYNWGLALANMKDYAGAAEKFRKTVELEPRYLPAYQSWGLALVELGQYDEAIAKFRKISQLNPKQTNDINKIIDKVQKMKAEKTRKGIKK